MPRKGLHKTFTTMIPYKVIPRKSPKDRSVKYYGVQHTRQMAEYDFVSRIVQKNTVTRADVLAVISSIAEELVYAIRNGNSVTLPEIGTFGFRIGTRGAETKDKFTTANIKHLRVKFLPSPHLKSEVKVGNPHVKFYNEEEPEEEP